MSEYPEHEKVAAIPDEIRWRIGDWIESQVIAEWGCPHGVTKRLPDGVGWRCEVGRCQDEDATSRLWTRNENTQQMMAEMFDIDYRALMDEKDAMLAELRAAAG